MSVRISKSFAAVDAARVIEACDAQAAANEARIASEREKLIQQQMAKDRRRGWPFFRETYRLNREQAIEVLKEHELCSWSPWVEVGMLGRAWDERARTLRALAEQSADGLVYVAEDMAWLVSKYGQSK